MPVDIPKVKRNIARMIDLGAPEREIDAYLKAAGVTIEQLHSDPMQPAPHEGYASPPEPSKAKRGMFWPVSFDEQGKRYFDPQTGILGLALGGPEAYGKIKRGELDPRSPEAMEKVAGAAAVTTPMGAVSRIPGTIAQTTGVLGRRSVKRGPAPVPTRDELRASAKAQSETAAGMGVEYQAPAIAEMAKTVEDSLNRNAVIESLAPKTHALLRELQTGEAGSFVRLQDLNAARKQFNRIAGSPDETEAFAANEAIRAIDEFYVAVDPANLVARPAATGPALTRQGHDFGPADRAAAQARAAEAAETLEASRGNFAAQFRSDRLAEVEEIMELRAAAANSGRNIDNTTRQRLVSFLKNRKGIRGFSSAEKKAIEDIVRGKRSKNATRQIGNWLGGGGGLGQLLLAGLGATAGGNVAGTTGAALGATLPMAIGTLARSIANNMSKKELKALSEMIRARSPLGAAAKGAPLEPAMIIEQALLKGFLVNLEQPEKPWPDAFQRPMVGPLSVSGSIRN